MNEQLIQSQELKGEALAWAVAAVYQIPAVILDGHVQVEAEPGKWLPFDPWDMLRSLVLGHVAAVHVPDEIASLPCAEVLSMQIKTSELTGAALDWAVAMVEWPPEKCSSALAGRQSDVTADIVVRNGEVIVEFREEGNPLEARYFKPSTSWAQGGPLIDRYNAEIRAHYLPEPTSPRQVVTDSVRHNAAEIWIDLPDGMARSGLGVGVSALVAVCRAVVAAKLGDEVDVPEELVKP